ncbi:class I SAM-dependent methyltransferase [Micromonospora sp. BRA006-A]|nr:class I SAM-dependent methyltransferase [Micromonospora sp. BRA006-A]
MNVFGTVADLYERARPGYPPKLAESIVAYHGGTPASVVEVGAGTGKGTEVLARLSAPLTCVEPDALMAARLAERFPEARVEATTFERWSPPAGGVDVLACAMAWHWLDAATRNALARRALAPGGTLAVFGHRYDYADAAQQAAVRPRCDPSTPPSGSGPSTGSTGTSSTVGSSPTYAARCSGGAAAGQGAVPGADAHVRAVPVPHTGAAATPDRRPRPAGGRLRWHRRARPADHAGAGPGRCSVTGGASPTTRHVAGTRATTSSPRPRCGRGAG